MANVEIDGTNSTVKTDKLTSQSGSTITVPTGKVLTVTDAAGLTVNGLTPLAADNSVTGAKIAAGAVTDAKIAAGAVTSAKIADDAVSLDKMAPGTDGNIITYDALGNPAAVATGTAGQVLTSAGAGAPPTFANAAAGGKVLQVVTNHVNTASSQSITINTVTNISNFSCPITPTSSSSKIMIQVIWSGEESTNSQDSIFGLKRGSTQIGSAPIVGTRSYGMTMGSGGYADENGSSGAFSVLNFIDSPATTSATTYYVTFMNKYVGATLYNNRTVADGDGTGYERMISSIVLTELSSATILLNGS
jgi:hypothetical protein